MDYFKGEPKMKYLIVGCCFLAACDAHISYESDPTVIENLKLNRTKEFEQTCEKFPGAYGICTNFFLRDIRDILKENKK